MKTLLVSAAIFILFSNASHSQVVVNEIMYTPAESSNEWYELYNTGSAPVNLQNWKWKDATSALRLITLQNITIDSGSYIVICQDSLKFKNQFPLTSCTIIQTAWSQLNNTGDNLLLIDPSGNRMDSVTFSSSWGGNIGGHSLEKIISSGPANNSTNWGNSQDQSFASPCRKNSITPKPYDMLIKAFDITPLFPSKGETLNMTFIVKNAGLNNAENFSLNIYNDFNFDSLDQENEVIDSHSFRQLAPNDSIYSSYSIQNIDSGSKQFIAKIIYEQDNDSLNNKIIRRLYVSTNSGGSNLVINEIMYDPLSNQSEWIELYNASGQTINIKGWKYKESSSNISLSSSDLFMNPGDYFLLAHDSTIYTTFDFLRQPEQNQSIRFSNSLSLNNSGEAISITDSLGNIIDAVSYNPDWHNSNLEDTKGISLERINPSFRSDNKSNWSSSAYGKGGTPGRQNSIYTENINSASEVTVFPNPFSPDNDGFEDFTMIKYKLNVQFAQMRVNIFDIKGRLVRTLINFSITGNEGSIIFNGSGDDNQILRVGIYILLIEAIDDRQGTVDIIKAPVVIAGKL